MVAQCVELIHEAHPWCLPTIWRHVQPIHIYPRVRLLAPAVGSVASRPTLHEGAVVLVVLILIRGVGIVLLSHALFSAGLLAQLQGCTGVRVISTLRRTDDG